MSGDIESRSFRVQVEVVAVTGAEVGFVAGENFCVEPEQRLAEALDVMTSLLEVV